MAKRGYIFIAIPEHGRDDECLDTGGVGPVHQYILCAVSSRVVVADDIKSSQNAWEKDGSEMRSRER